MDVQEAITARRSIRKYEDRPVEDEKLRLLLEAARLAPSGSNTQPTGLIVIRSPEQRQAVSLACNNQKFIATAPVLIAVLGDLKCRVDGRGQTLDINATRFTDERQRIIRDCAIAGEQIVLQAEELGLGTCWVADFIQEEIRRVLGAPSDQYVLAVIAVGYPAEAPAARRRKALTEMVWHELFGQKETGATSD